jgi:hypothetical protein
VTGATGYTIQVSKNAAFTPLVLNKTATFATYTPTTALPASIALLARQGQWHQQPRPVVFPNLDFHDHTVKCAKQPRGTLGFEGFWAYALTFSHKPVQREKLAIVKKRLVC